MQDLCLKALNDDVSPAPRLISVPSLADQVRNLLMEALTSGRLRPGDRVNEAELARELGISRNPIREAISGLAQRGFLVPARGRGHYLRRFTSQDVDDVFSFRICVESFAIHQALPRMTKVDHADLADIIDRMTAAARQLRVADLHQHDVHFHRHICELSGNTQVVRAHESIDTEVRMLIASVDLVQETPTQAALAHLPIVQAMADGDAVRAVAALEQHLTTTWRHVLRTIHGADSANENSTSRRLA